MRRLVLYGALLASPVAASAGRRAPSLVAQLVATYLDPALGRAVLAGRVDEIGGDVVWEADPRALLVPASTVKLVTAMALLEAEPDLGATIDTPLVGTGPIVDGVLSGDLVLVGQGDPSLGVAALEGWIRQIRARGVTRIQGEVLADASLFAPPGLGAGWMWDDVTSAFSPPITAVAWEGNAGDATFTPGGAVGDPIEVQAHPCVPIRVDAATTAEPSDLTIRRPPGQTATIVWGGMAVGAPRQAARITLPDPPACAAGALRDALVAAGIEVVGATVARGRPEVVAVHRSRPLRELLRDMLVRSDNLMAESLALRLDPSPTGRTFDGALPAYRRLFAAAAIPEDGWRLVDGSGLSRYDLLAADTLVGLLRFGWGRPWRDTWVGLLPAPGEGTLTHRLGETDRIVAKTGSMRGVFNIAGYVMPEVGPPLAFALMSNGVVQPGAEVRARQDAVLRLLAHPAPAVGCHRAGARGVTSR